MATDEFISICGVLVQFKGNSKYITIPDGIRKIDPRVFASCNNIEKVSLPESLSIIAGGAFSGCHNLKHISMPDSVEIIGPHAFGR